MPSWLRPLLRPARPAAPSRRPARWRPRLEALEERTLLESTPLASTLQAISVPPPDRPPSDTAAGASTAPSVSADGRFVAYTSTAPNLAAGQAPVSGRDVFLFDALAGTSTLVSHVSGSATTPTAAPCDRPLVSGGGGFVAYDSTATDLAGSVASPQPDVFLYNRLTGANVLVSHSSTSAALPADAPSHVQAVSADGQFVVFLSSATDLVAGQSGPAGPNLFLYDAATGQVSLVSHAAGSATAAAGADPGAPFDAADIISTANDVLAGLSDDGRFVTYVSTSTALVAGQGANTPNVFLYDRTTGINTLVSAVSGSPGVGAGGCLSTPAINRDGNFVAFVSSAPNLVPGQTPNPQPLTAGYNVFRYSRLDGSVTLVSHAPGLTSTVGSGDSGQINFGAPQPRGFLPLARAVLAIASDGSAIAFPSRATNLVPGQTGLGVSTNLFLWSASTNAVTLVSGTAGSATNASSTSPSPPLFSTPGVPQPGITYLYVELSISGDGRRVAYASHATDLVAGQAGPAGQDNVFLFDVATGVSRLVTGAAGSATAAAGGPSQIPVLSADGSALALQSYAPNLSGTLHDFNGTTDVFVYVLGAAPGLTLVSRAAFPQAQVGGASFSTSVSADGRFTVFTSTATDLLTNQVSTNNNQNVFLFDKQTGTTVLVNHLPGLFASTGDAGLGLDDPSQAPDPTDRPVISADGNFVAFVSRDSNLITGVSSATDHIRKVFVYSRLTGQVTQISPGPPDPGTRIIQDASHPAISADGHYVAYVDRSGTFAYAQVNEYDTVAGTSTPVAISDQGFPQVDPAPSISDDGRFVTFSAFHDPSPSGQFFRQVYLFDRTNPNVLAVVSHIAGSPASLGEGDSGPAVISHDGTRVAFVSQATDLVSAETGPAGNVFLYDVASGAVSLASGVGGSATAAAGSSDSPDISGDGNWVAYRSDAADLVPGQSGPAGSNVFEYDRLRGTQSLVSHAAGQATVTAGASTLPVIDDDGHLVSFASTAGNLVSGQTGPAGVKNVFVWYRPSGLNLLVSGQGGSFSVGGNADSDLPLLSRQSISDFSSSANNLVKGVGGLQAYLNDIERLNSLVTLTLSGSIVADGSPAGTAVGAVAVASSPLGQLGPPPVFSAAGAAPGAPFGINPGTDVLLTGFAAHFVPGGANAYVAVVTFDIGIGPDFRTFTIAVPQPPPPTVTQPPDRSVSVGSGPVTFSFTVGSPFFPADQLTVSASSDNTALVPDANIVPGGSGASRTETVTPAPLQTGTAALTLTVRDPDGGTDSVVVHLNVGRAPTAVALAASASSIVSGQAVTFIATVSGSGPGEPTGTVTFRDGSAVLGTAPVGAGGVAALTAPALAAGSHRVTADYGGDSLFGGRTSAAVDVHVARAEDVSTTLNGLALASVFGFYDYTYGTHSIWSLYAYGYAYWAQYWGQVAMATGSLGAWQQAAAYSQLGDAYAHQDFVSSHNTFAYYADYFDYWSWIYAGYVYAELT
jgi:Tol biopolymer transport system component